MTARLTFAVRPSRFAIACVDFNPGLELLLDFVAETCIFGPPRQSGKLYRRRSSQWKAIGCSSDVAATRLCKFLKFSPKVRSACPPTISFTAIIPQVTFWANQETESIRMPASPARTAAFDILLRVAQEAAYASELLHAPRHTGLTKADHGLATELVMGVLRWQSVLDNRIAEHSSLPLHKLDSQVLIA